ncbi:hypothetical protein H257_05996 [Aphanomyces astaci]|uniref:Fibronectin type-III domain-containing protein n=1 Tax=Aphanomyces astaci TaxID=112090 RepID=W4GR57_APHAT|nr:hypothetical protein H257_05996 [Aphanomyces astaci]ETV81494.1 hypothetical protein H257_05996 [Aphanomyces astaci]|eukprot:XP_009829352.1 hypothetical protein H257_05996 [Aphanomyces astaci]
MRCGAYPWAYMMWAFHTACGTDMDHSVDGWTSEVQIDASLGADIDDNVPLEESLARCKAQGYTRGNSHLDSSLDPTFVKHCNKIQYMELILHAQEGSNHNDPHTPSPTFPVRIWPNDAATVNDDASFQDFFQKHVLHAEPAEASDVLSLPPAFLATCFDPALGSSTLNIHSPPCQDLLPSFHVPTCVANDYMQRINTSHPITLPTLLRTESPVATHCRYGLNMALVSVEGAGGLSVSVSTRAPSADEYMLPLRQDPVDTTPASPPSSPSSAQSSLVLGYGRVLFIPNGHAATFQGAALRFCYTDASNFNRMKQHLRVEALLDPAVRARLVAFQDTTFDSSMIRRVSRVHTAWPSFRQWPKPQHLAKESRHDGSTSSLSRRERYKLWQDDRKWDTLIKGLTLPVTRPPLVLDAAQDIHRTAITLTWQDVFQARKGDITRYGYQVSWVPDKSSIQSMPATADIGIQRRNLSSAELVRSALPTTAFGDAFDGKAIQGTITGLRPNTSYTFSLQLYVGDDIGLHSERSASMRTASMGVPSVVRGQPIVLQNTLLEAPSCVSLSWLPPEDDGGCDIVGYVVSARYDPRPKTAADSSVDDAMTWHPFNTTSQFDVVQSVVVSTRELTLDPTNVTGAVCNLRMRQTYQFQVAAMNALGVGSFSMWTPPLLPSQVSTASTSKARQDVVRGVGAPHFHRVYDREHLDDLASAGGDDVVGPVMHLSDTQQLLQPYQLIAPSLSTAVLRYDANGKLVWTSWFAHVWPGHFSPKLYSVVAELVVANPILADKPLENNVRDRLVVVRRGKLPLFNKVYHAQAAGALGVIILDEICDDFDHHCSAGSNLAFGEGFGAQDDAAVWAAIRIPHVLLRRGDAADLVARLPVASQSLLTDESI